MSTRDVIWTIVLTTGIGLLPHQHAEAQCRVNEGTKLTASDGQAEDHFGRSECINADVADAARIRQNRTEEEESR